MDSGCAGGDSQPWASPTFQRLQLSQLKEAVPALFGLPPKLRHKLPFSSSEHFLSIPRKCFPVGMEALRVGGRMVESLGDWTNQDL